MNRRSSILESPKFAQKKRRKTIIVTLLFLLCFILLIVISILFLRLPFLQIDRMKISGVVKIDVNSIQQDVLGELEGNYFLYIPKSNTFFYPKAKIEDKLLRTHKEIDALDISRDGLSGIEIDIKEKKAEALVCDGFYNEDDQNKECYSVDKDGYVFEKSPFFSEGVFPHYYYNLSDNNIILGNYFIDIDLFKKLQKFVKAIQNAHISTAGLLIGEEGQYELYIKNTDLSECIVYFDNRTPFEKTAENLIAFWNDSLNKSKIAKKEINYDYINLRFGNNIFYVTK